MGREWGAVIFPTMADCVDLEIAFVSLVSAVIPVDITTCSSQPKQNIDMISWSQCLSSCKKRVLK